jgi:cytochrome c
MPSKSSIGIAAAGTAALCLLAATAAVAQDKPNWRDGRKIFKKCEACHSFKPGEHRFGPSLNKVVGRQAGTAPDFSYSETMLAKSADGLVWSDETLDTFLTAPKKFIKKTKMTFPGLKKARDRRNVIAYVKRRAKR